MLPWLHKPVTRFARFVPPLSRRGDARGASRFRPAAEVGHCPGSALLVFRGLEALEESLEEEAGSASKGGWLVAGCRSRRATGVLQGLGAFATSLDFFGLFFLKSRDFLVEPEEGEAFVQRGQQKPRPALVREREENESRALSKSCQCMGMWTANLIGRMSSQA